MIVELAIIIISLNVVKLTLEILSSCSYKDLNFYISLRIPFIDSPQRIVGFKLDYCNDLIIL